MSKEWFFVFIVLSTMTIMITASISPATIEADANEITRLHREFLDRSPSIAVHHSYKVRCRAITECCPQEIQHLYTILSEGQFNDRCLANGTRLLRSSASLTCLSNLHQLIQITKDPVYDRYFQVLGNSTIRFNRIKIWKKQMKMACSEDELHAYYCERDNIDKFKSCQRKVLNTVARDNIDDPDGLIYKTYVSQWEQEYAIDNQKLTKAFPSV